MAESFYSHYTIHHYRISILNRSYFPQFQTNLSKALYVGKVVDIFDSQKAFWDIQNWFIHHSPLWCKSNPLANIFVNIYWLNLIWKMSELLHNIYECNCTSFFRFFPIARYGHNRKGLIFTTQKDLFFHWKWGVIEAVPASGSQSQWSATPILLPCSVVLHRNETFEGHVEL